METKYRSILMLSADTPERLRATDVYRVMSEASNMNCLDGFTQWLRDQEVTERVRKEIEECLEELS